MRRAGDELGTDAEANLKYGATGFTAGCGGRVRRVRRGPGGVWSSGVSYVRLAVLAGTRFAFRLRLGVPEAGDQLGRGG